MRLNRVFLSIIAALLLSITANAETITFPAGVYDGAVDSKGRANGQGVFKFKNGFIYEGNFSKNKIHKEGKFIDDAGKIIYEGKTSYGRFNIYLTDDKSARNNSIAKLETGFDSKIEMKKNNKWYEAEEVNGVFELTIKGQMEFDNDQKGGSSGGSSGGGCGG
jgi:hypothetical protein